MRLCSIASGSSGNCIYIGSDSTHILVDVGISGKRTEAGLKELELSMRDIDGIFITHEHTDHIAGLGVDVYKRQSGSTAFEHGMDCAGAPGKFPSGKGLGTVY